MGFPDEVAAASGDRNRGIEGARMVESVQRRLSAREIRLGLALAVVSLLTALSTGRAADPEPEVVGQSLYRVYCESCHGNSGKGDGSTAAYLTIKPSDLTRLSRRNGGEFPTERLRQIIDGREAVRVHGEREMPLWGLAFQDWNADAHQEEAIRQKISQLLSYLETIQKK